MQAAMAERRAEEKRRAALRRKRDDVMAKAWDKKYGKSLHGFVGKPTKVKPVKLIHGNPNHPDAEKREDEMQAWGERHSAILNGRPEPPLPVKAGAGGGRKRRRPEAAL